MADLFWKSVPAAFNKPTLDKLYNRLRDLDYPQVDERLAIMLNAILRLESQGECWESATEAVLMVGYTSDGISNQEQIRWLSWIVDGCVRGFELARNPGLGNMTKYGAGEFPLPTRPLAGIWTQSTSKPLSMTRSQQTEEAIRDLSNLKRVLERAQRERDKANLDRDEANLERDQANLERDQAILEQKQAVLNLNLVRAKGDQAQKLQESAANCEQIKSEIERPQRRQQEFVNSNERTKKTMTEPVATRSRPESRMEMDEAPRSSGRFHLGCLAQEHMNEGLETWTLSEPVPSVRNLEAGRIRPLMDIAMPGLTPSSTSGSQTGTGTSRLKELQEWLQSRALESPAREEQPADRR